MNESNDNSPLVEKISYLRQRALKRKRKYAKQQLETPIAFWTKEDRLLDGIGKEFPIILRTRGCEWALSSDAGCSMCGYVQDSHIQDVLPEQIIKQFDHAINGKLNEIEGDEQNYVLKIFNSGSFFDDDEINENVRAYIYDKISGINKIKEVVVESRVEFITKEKLLILKQALDGKHVEIGIGLETVDDNVRNRYINKGLVYKDFLNAVQSCKENDIGVKAYLLLKPPFLNEQSAIDDCVKTIKTLIDLKVNTISINPVNIQKGTLVEYLWYQKRYRPPWYYSLFKCLKKAIKQEDLKSIRVVSDPSGSGTKRGIHNCLKRECNENMKEILNQFVLSQDISELEKLKQDNYSCDCKLKYQLQRDFL